MLRSCALALAMLLLALAAPAYAQTAATSGSASGGTPAASSDSDPTISSSGGAATSAAEASDATSAGTDAPMSGDVPLATVAQEPEPEPEPEGPGEEQPGEPGGEPQTPTGEDPVEVPGGEAPASGGGTGIEVLKLGLLGLVLVLVGARIRAVLKRRGRVTGLAPDGLPHAAPSVATRGRRDEWSFPDPDEAAPTGLLPSTAMARRKARMREP